MASDKIAEANACIREAEKCLKTSFLKWKPDYDGAASEYSKAATCFRTVKALEQCKDALLKAADCYGKNQSYFSAAKSYEQAALISKELHNYEALVQLVGRACQLFREHGTPDTAALTLEKGAKMIESKFPEQAIDLYRQAAEIVSLEDRPKQAADYTGKAARLLVKLKRYEEAAVALRKEMSCHVEAEDEGSAGRLVVALVLLYLTQEDYVAADRIYKEGACYVSRDEAGALIDLLEGFDQGDPEQMYQALNHPFIKHMDVEYAKLARNIQNSVKLNISSKAAAKSAAAKEDIRSEETEDLSGLL